GVKGAVARGGALVADVEVAVLPQAEGAQQVVRLVGSGAGAVAGAHRGARRDTAGHQHGHDERGGGVGRPPPPPRRRPLAGGGCRLGGLRATSTCPSHDPFPAPGRAKKKPPPCGWMYSSSGSPSSRACVLRNWLIRRWYETKARPWSRRPPASKPREKLIPLRKMRSASVAAVRGLARRMWASSGVTLPSGSAAKSGMSVSRRPSRGAPLLFCRPISASCSCRAVRSQNS